MSKHAILLSLLLFAVPAAAQTTYTWNGANPGDWTAAANWSPSGVPGIEDTVIIGSGEPVLNIDTTVVKVIFSAGMLSGDGNLTVTDTFSWSGGTLNGRNFAETAALTIPEGSVLFIESEETKGLRGRDILNDGQIVWEGAGSLEVMWPTLIENRSDATFEIRDDAPITRSNGTLIIENEGLIVKAAGSGTSTFGYPFGEFVNAGVVRVEAGTLLLNNGISSFTASGDGSFEIEADASLRFNQATYNFGTASTVTGLGTLLSTGGTTNLGAAALSGPTVVAGGLLRFINESEPTELTDVTISDGGLGGPGVVNVNGFLTWTGGSLGIRNDEGEINFLGGASAEGDGAKTFAGGTYNNAGTFTWTGTGDLVVNTGGTFHNLEEAVFDIRNDAALTRSNGTLVFVNSGVITKSESAGTTSIEPAFAPFNNDGEIRVESGTLYVRVSGSGSNSTDTGSWIVDEGATLRFNLHQRTFTETASLGGTGTVDFSEATIVNRGTVRPGFSAGTLTVQGDYPTPQPEGVLEIELGGAEPDVQHDVLSAANIANLGGILRLALTDGFEPTGEESFTFVTALAVQGAFAEIEPPEGYVAEVVYGAQDAGVQIVPVSRCEDGLQPDEHTLALYKFDEPLPGTSFDDSGNGLDGTDEGTTVVDGRFCNARRFDGESDRIDIDGARAALQGQTEWTIEYVARSENGSGVPELINHACGNGWWLGPRSTSVRFGIKTTGVSGNCPWAVGEAFASAEMDTEWHYYALAWDGDTLRVYRDGMLLDQRAAGGVFLENQSSTNRAWIGHSDSGSGSYFSGLADDLRISDVARPGDELFETAADLGFADPTSSHGEDGVPSAFTLHPNYPNPFNPSTLISYDVPKTAGVMIRIYSVLGRQLVTLVDRVHAPGSYETQFDAADLPSGLYFIRMETKTFSRTRTMVLAK